MNTTSNTTRFNHELLIPPDFEGWRVDAAMASLLPQYSRARLTAWIKSGEIKINGAIFKPKDKLSGGESALVAAEMTNLSIFEPENIPLSIVYEDEALIVLNKPAGLVAHPAAGNWTGTLVNALLYHCKELAQLPRAGLVHRLDKDTTGLMVVAKTLESHSYLVSQLQERNIKRCYEAVVNGTMVAGSSVNAPIGRHPKSRQKMSVNHHNGKPAVTHFRVKKRFSAHTHLDIQLETGRTHQIRVHMDYIQYPIVGDPLYTGRRRFPKGCSPELRAFIEGFGRQALHARSLGLIHPTTGEECLWEAPLPDDMNELLRILATND
jgi:23S rRNA pseudouridine1911/1915/1917 synthase